MSIKCILVGGYPNKAADGGRAFSEELVRGFKEPVRILECLFARRRDQWLAAFEQSREFLSKNLPEIEFRLTLADPSSFIEQLRNADAVNLRAGNTELLMKALNQTGDWLSRLDGKTLAGSSAGADLMAKYYYDIDRLELGSGLGLVPVKTLVHYRSDYNAPNVDWAKAERLLKEYKEDIEILKLPEGSFVVREAAISSTKNLL